MQRFDLSLLLLGFIALSGVFCLHIFVIEGVVSAREEAPNFFVFVPDLSFAYSCPSTDDNESDYFKIYDPFLIRHGFEVRGSPQDFVAIDKQHRMIQLIVTLNGSIEHHFLLYSEPPTVRDPELEQDVLSLVSNTLKCNITDVRRQTNARSAKFAYDRIFRQTLWRYQD